MVKETKWVSGQEPVAGMYIQPKLPFAPEVVVNDVNGVKYSFKQLVKYYKGSGRFKSGIPIGVTASGEPVTLYVDVRIGKKASEKTNDALSAIEL
jgi:hypothetical protein